MRIMNRAGLAIAGAGLLGLVLIGSAAAARGEVSGPGALGKGGLIAHVASVEGVTPAVLRQDLKEGKTLLQIAGSKYASADDLATALLAPVKTRLDAAVAHHRLTAAQETVIYSRLHARVDTLVVTPHPLQHARHLTGPAAARTHFKSSVLQSVATLCGTTPKSLQTAFRAGGKTPLAICQATNAKVTKDSLVTALTSAFKARLEARAQKLGIVLSPAQEQNLLARVQTRVSAWVVTPLPVHSAHL
jgi:hypothetical protein